MAQTRLYFIAYDVANPRRWRRVYKALRRRGAWQQLSAFICRLTPHALADLEAELRRHIDAGRDRLMIVDLGPGAEAEDRLRRSARCRRCLAPGRTFSDHREPGAKYRRA